MDRAGLGRLDTQREIISDTESAPGSFKINLLPIDGGEQTAAEGCFTDISRKLMAPGYILHIMLPLPNFDRRRRSKVKRSLTAEPIPVSWDRFNARKDVSIH